VSEAPAVCIPIIITLTRYMQCSRFQLHYPTTLVCLPQLKGPCVEPEPTLILAVHLIFRFVTGFAGSAFLAVAGGTVADLFETHKLGT
jgi:MFS family permease